MARDIVKKLERAHPERRVKFVAQEGVVAFGDANLLAVALENLLGNAWKFTSKRDEATIEFGVDVPHGGGSVVYYVRDDGAGFDPRYADKLFGAFQRLHGSEEFEGTGIGLATVARIVHRHGGGCGPRAEVGEGATFCFTLGGRQGARRGRRTSGEGAGRPAACSWSRYPSRDCSGEDRLLATKARRRHNSLVQTG